ncbi:MAG: serine hydrolase [Oscillospiraceae bacterium]|nr:serine hydrolase [Oscillospiraceae bacterium]
MGAVYEQIEAGKIKESSVSAKLTYMITISDNQSCNDLVKLLGNGNRNAGIGAVNAFIRKYGFTETSMTRLMLENTGTQNYTSIRDCADFLRMLYRGELVSDTASKSMLNLMKQAHRIHCAAGLPASVGFAHKTGALMNLCYGDVGIVYADQPYILCAINSGTSDGPTVLQTVSSQIYHCIR